ncbi:MAG: ABC transporter substrate-binding protein [Deltaproteobacteria bacterium]|nr:ABC transporter substrate-binding protein [Deltaproteobacteria bacterium]
MEKPMLKKILVFVVATVFLTTGSLAEAQQSGKVRQIGVLSPGTPPRPVIEGLRQGLRELGYVEGQNIRFEYRYAEWKVDRLPELAAELVRLKPDIIFTHSVSGAQAAKRATTTIPIVIGASGDLVQYGIVASLARPGGNVTGLSLLSMELDGKRLELLKETSRKLSRVAVLVNPANPAWQRYPQDLEPAGRALGLRLQLAEASGPTEFERAFSAILQGGVDGLLVVSEPLFQSYQTRIAELAAKHHLPSISEVPGFAEAGGLIQYGLSITDMGRRAATYVDKILKGAKAADLPVERPTKFEFYINLKTAKQIGLTIPPNVLARADKVIK